MKIKLYQPNCSNAENLYRGLPYEKDESLAQHGPVPQGHLAVQPQVRRRKMLHTTPDRGRDKGGVHHGGEQGSRRQGHGYRDLSPYQGQRL